LPGCAASSPMPTGRWATDRNDSKPALAQVLESTTGISEPSVSVVPRSGSGVHGLAIRSIDNTAPLKPENLLIKGPSSLYFVHTKSGNDGAVVFCSNVSIFLAQFNLRPAPDCYILRSISFNRSPL
jgi:hypothetical protein